MNGNWLSAGALISALIAIIGGSIAYGEQSEKVLQLEQRTEKLENLHEKLNELTTQQAVQQTKFDILIQQLNAVNRKLDQQN